MVFEGTEKKTFVKQEAAEEGNLQRNKNCIFLLADIRIREN